MNTKFLKLFTAAMVIVFSGSLISCSDDESNSQVILDSFGPSGVEHGDTLKFIGQNLNKVTSIMLPNAEVSSAAFLSQSARRIELLVPAEAEAGKVVLKTPEGDVESITVLNFLVPVVIESITEEARPGANITITGDKLNWIEAITFDENLTVTEFVSQTINELVVTVPMEAESGYLIFSSGGTEPLTFSSEEELMVTLPAITSFTPSVKHTDVLTINGTDLDLVVAIQLGGNKTVAASAFTAQSESQIKFPVPVGTENGKFTLVQLSPINVVSETDLNIILPKGTALTPTPAEPGVDIITITGTNLDLVGALYFNGMTTATNASSFTTQTATTISVPLPEEATTGAVFYETIHGYKNNLAVNVMLPGSGPLPLLATIYDDALQNGFGNWSWGGGVDLGSTEMFIVGSAAVKKTFDGSWDGLRFGGAALSTSGTTEIAFSVYGGPGMEGKAATVVVNENWSGPTIIIEEGEWKEYRFQLSAVGSPAQIQAFGLQGQGISGTIYVDHIGLR